MARTFYACPDCETVQSASGRRPGWCPICEKDRYFELVDDGAERSSPPSY